MNNNEYNSFMQKQKGTYKVFQANTSQAVKRRGFQELLHRLSNTNDIDVLVKIFSTLGICLLSKNIIYKQAIKCDTLYTKLDLVLKSNLQTKAIVALKLISAVLNVMNEVGSIRTLHVYAKNIIRTSGCLTTMTEMFTSIMMQQDVWRALCRSLSEACEGNVPNQSHCSHLVPLCILRCRRGNLDPIQILISLLTNHAGNVKLFHESNGMTIFNGESLHNPAFLQLLNIVVENTIPEHHIELLEASDVFRKLRLYFKKYGLNSTVGQWISIVLFTHRKVIGNEINVDDKDTNFSKHQNNKTGPSSTNETINETNELLANVLKEAIGWQNQFSNKKFNNIYSINNKVDNIEVLPSFAKICKPNIKEQLAHNPGPQRNNDIYRFCVENTNKNDLSFSFLMKDNQIEERFSKIKSSFKLEQPPADEMLASDYDTSLTRLDNTLNIFKYDEYFKPPFASTPKTNKHAYVRPIFRLSQKTNSINRISRDRSVYNNIINKRKQLNCTASNKIIRDKSMTAKFMDIVNGSCTTLIKGFKSMFAAKKLSDSFDKSKEFSIEVEENNSYTCGFNNYSQQRNGKENKDQNGTSSKQFTMEISDLHSCNTCDDTIVLKHKFNNDVFLRQTVKRLKLAINIYGCDFKKISRCMWPREAYMTPNVLYNLYRKLIIKQ